MGVYYGFIFICGVSGLLLGLITSISIKARKK